jgi:hypothetical protein
MAEGNIQSEPQPERTPKDENWNDLGRIATYRKHGHMNKSTAIVLVIASLIMGSIIGGLTVAALEARQNELGARYESDFIMREIDQLSKCEEQNRDLQKRIKELEEQP